MRPDIKDDLQYKQQIEGVTNALPSRLLPVCLAMAAATLTALLLGSAALLSWVNNLPIGPVSDFLLNWAQQWQNLMQAVGLTRVADAFRALLAWWQSLA